MDWVFLLAREPSDYHCEPPVDKRVTLMVVFFMNVFSLFHFIWDLGLNQYVFKNVFDHLSLNGLVF